ncbi:MAG: hypothetical protein EOP45_03700 [Sphingobacteriaceae bacterium]|nr:MAG: hypothetical protein EOP45_03700 [Sphingobacteriaceae bacterium]
MGWFGSSEENIDMESKTVDSNGNINNNIILQEASDTHHQMITNEKLLVATYVLVFAEFMKMGIYVFHTFRRMWKKKYQGRK